MPNYGRKQSGSIRRVRGRGGYKTGSAASKSKPKRAKKGNVAVVQDGKGNSWLAPLLSTAGGAIGSFIAPGAGTAVGSAIGNLAGRAIKGLTGFGEYELQQNSLMVPEANDPPEIVNSGRELRIRHREYLTDIVTSPNSGQFQLNNYFINPGLSSSFPWLSGIAANFESYEVRGIVFEFKTMSADALNSTNTALGEVILATDYNAANANFTGVYDMLNYQYAVSTKPSCSIMHPVECKKSDSVLTSLYVRTGAVPSGDDIRLYDFGNFQIATNGFQGTSVNVGQLWVTYEFAFYKPKLTTAMGNNVAAAKIYSTGVTSTAPFGTSRSILSTSTITPVFSSNTTFRMPVGIPSGTTWLVVLNYTATTSTTMGAPGVSATSNATLDACWALFGSPPTQDGVNLASTNGGSSVNGTYSVQTVFIFTTTNYSLPNTNVGFTIATGGTLPTGTVMDMVITQIPQAMIT